MAFDPTKYGARPISNVSPASYSGLGSGTPVEPANNPYGATFRATGRETPIEAGLKAAGNLPSSALSFAKGIASVVAHPIETGKGILRLGGGLVEKFVPGQQANEIYADAVGGFLRDRFGSLENAQKTAIEDPFGFATDILGVVYGGAALVGKTAQLTKVGSLVASPITKPISKATTLGGRATRELTTSTVGVATGVGKEAFEQALKGSPEFTAGLRGKVNMTEVLDDARAGLDKIRKVRSENYTSAMNNLAINNPQSLEITTVINKAKDLARKFNIKLGDEGLDLSRSPLVNDQRKIESIFNLIETWGSQAGDRTVRGLDLLKRQIRYFREPTNPTLNAFVDDIANSVKSVAAKVDGYLDIQNDYGRYSEFIDELERTLSLRESVTPDSAISKLNSLLRDNADYRRVLAEELRQVTGKDIIGSVAGKALSRVTPQGLAKYVALGASYSFPHIIPYLALTSPRIMGEFFRVLGLSGRAVGGILDDVNNFRVAAGLRTITEKLPKEVQDYIKNPKIGLSIEDVSKKTFQPPKTISTKLLEKFRGLPNEITPQQFNEVINKAQKEGIKKVDLDMVREATKEVNGKISLPQLAKDVEKQLVPLTPTPVKSPRWSHIGEDFIGDGKYGEIVYQSPIKTSAGDIHYSTGYVDPNHPKALPTYPGYYSHVRYENLADGKTRKLIEVQSDLFQKNNFQETAKGLLREKQGKLKFGGKTGEYTFLDLEKNQIGFRPVDGKEQVVNFDDFIKQNMENLSELTKLRNYESNDPLAHLRTFREEVKRAAKDGKDTLLVPSGRTALEIEGLVSNKGANRWWDITTHPTDAIELKPDMLKVGKSVRDGVNDWVITGVLPEGKFKAIPSKIYQDFPKISKAEIDSFIKNCL